MAHIWDSVMMTARSSVALVTPLLPIVVINLQTFTSSYNNTEDQIIKFEKMKTEIFHGTHLILAALLAGYATSQTVGE